MKKIILYLLIAIIILPLHVKAEQVTIPVPKFYIDTLDGTGSSDGVLASWWGTNNYYESYYPIFKVVSGIALTTGANVQLPNVNWCEGQQVHIVGKLAVLTNFFQTSSLSFWASNGGKALTCSYTALGSGDEMQFDCVGTGGKGFMIGFSIHHYDISNHYSVGINRTMEVTCDASNLSVIENQNQNKNEIINNQNQNTNEIKNSIGSMGSSINSSIDRMKDKQDETNNKLEESNQTSKGILGKIGDLLSSIIELPGKLVSLLIDGLKSLFVPTDEQLYEIINDSKDLAENFGFVGESMNFFITIFTSLLGMVNANGCIELPEFAIGATSLTPSITFWHAQNVCLNDNLILSSNITTIRTITSIVLVALFVNFASRKFFSILSKNENDSHSISYDPRTGEVRE